MCDERELEKKTTTEILMNFKHGLEKSAKAERFFFLFYKNKEK